MTVAARLTALSLSAFLLAPLAATTPAQAQSLADPGPAWAGISDTTSLGDRIEAHVGEAERLLDAVRAVEGPRTAENTALPYWRAEFELATAQQLAQIALNVHPDSAFRAYARTRDARLSEQQSALAVDRALYDALSAVDPGAMTPEHRYILDQDLEGFRRDGAWLDEASRARVSDLRARIAEVGTRYEQNIHADIRSIAVSPDSLAGLPPDLVTALTAGPTDDAGRLVIPITPDVLFPIVVFAQHADVRARAGRAFLGRGHPQNAPLIDSLRTLRHELATLLGYESWAAYSLASRMARTPERVAAFIDEVAEASEAAAEREAAALLAFRQRYEPEATSVSLVDAEHWTYRLQQEDYAFDAQALRPYFPYAAVRDGMLDAYGEMFGLEFRPAPDAPTWADAAEPYEVWEDGALVGRFTLDMHPREGKFSHFAAFPLRLGGGKIPEGALVCNFPGGADGDPGLLDMGQVATLFHEFGHLIHMLTAGRAEVFSEFEWDFVEAPSQLLEAWAKDHAVLARFARHYETGEPIPAELVAAYRRADAFDRASAARQNLWLSALALDLHTAPPEEAPTAEVERRAASYSFLEFPDWMHPASSVQHLYGYSSNYYTYLWSDVIARDLLTGFDREDLLAPDAGRRYLDELLAPTGTAPSAVLVERFLGRPFNADAWRAWLRGE